MARPDPTPLDRQRLERLDRTVRELETTERKADDLRAKRNVLIYQVAGARILPAAELGKRASVGESFVYRCLHDKGKPKTGGAR